MTQFSSCRRAILAIQQAWHLKFQISYEECNVYPIEGTIAINIARGIKGIGCKRAGWETIYWRRIIVSLKIIDTIDNVDSVGRAVVVYVAGSVFAK